MNIVTELINIPDSTVYGFFNEKLKIAWIGYSTNTPLALIRNLRDLKSSNNLDGFEFRILNLVTNPKELRTTYSARSLEYRNQGWSLMRSFKISSYTLHTEFMSHLDSAGVPIYYWRVYLRSRGRRNVVVGVFDTYESMDEFISSNYPSGPIYSIVLAQNELSKKYVSSN